MRHSGEALGHSHVQRTCHRGRASQPAERSTGVGPHAGCSVWCRLRVRRMYAVTFSLQILTLNSTFFLQHTTLLEARLEAPVTWSECRSLVVPHYARYILNTVEYGSCLIESFVCVQVRDCSVASASLTLCNSRNFSHACLLLITSYGMLSGATFELRPHSSL